MSFSSSAPVSAFRPALQKVLRQAIEIGSLPVGKWNLADACRHLIDAEPKFSEWFEKWSVQMFLLFKLQRQNVVAVGDLGVRRGINMMYGISESKAKAMKEKDYADLIAHWAPYSSLGCCLMWKSIDMLPTGTSAAATLAAAASPVESKKRKDEVDSAVQKKKARRE